MRDPFRVLYLAPGAPPEVIEAAHRALVKLLHPDRAGADTTAAMARVNAARDVLRDPGERARLSRQLVRDDAPPPAARVAMPFGKHRGAPLGTLPSDYLEWLLSWDGLRPGLRRDIEAVLAWRES